MSRDVELDFVAIATSLRDDARSSLKRAKQCKDDYSAGFFEGFAAACAHVVKICDTRAKLDSVDMSRVYPLRRKKA